MSSLSAVAAVPKREQARQPVTSEATLTMQAFLQLHGLFSDRCDSDYVHRVAQFLLSMESSIVDSWNGHNGAPLKLPLTCSLRSSTGHRFKNAVFPRFGSSYDEYCKARYMSTLLYVNAPLIKDSIGNMVSIEAVWIVVAVRPQYGLFVDRPVQSRILAKEMSIVAFGFHETKRAETCVKRGLAVIQ